MSLHRYAANVDKSQQAIVDAIEAEGWDVYLIRTPCDLLCWHPVLDVWQPLEVKNPGRCNAAGESWDRKQQVSQQRFLKWTEVPVVTSKDQALAALRFHYPTAVVTAELIAWAARIRDEFERNWNLNKSATPSARQLVELHQSELGQRELL